MDISDINSVKAITILKEYEGKNPYIKKLKLKLEKNNKLLLTNNQSNYIVNNHEFKPKAINKIISITNYLGEELKKSEQLTFTPEKILMSIKDLKKT